MGTIRRKFCEVLQDTGFEVPRDFDLPIGRSNLIRNLGRSSILSLTNTRTIVDSSIATAMSYGVLDLPIAPIRFIYFQN